MRPLGLALVIANEHDRCRGRDRAAPCCTALTGVARVFASANMEHPQALSAAKKSGPVVLFARNRLCAMD
jgi:hypothetical protein